MRPIEELKTMTHITGIGPEPGFPERACVNHAFVQWDDLKIRASVIFGYNENGLMEHVSIRPQGKTVPSWEAMCRLKDLFFYPEEMVVQIHPKASRYFHGIGTMQNVLHLWRPKSGDFSILNRPELWD